MDPRRVAAGPRIPGTGWLRGVTSGHHAGVNRVQKAGQGTGWSREDGAAAVRDREVAGSNPAPPTNFPIKRGSLDFYDQLAEVGVLND